MIIRGATLINGNGSPPRGPVDIVIENNVIKDIKVVGYPGVEINDDNRPKLKEGGKELDAALSRMVKAARRRIRTGDDVRCELLFIDIARHFEQIGGSLVGICTDMQSVG